MSNVETRFGNKGRSRKRITEELKSDSLENSNLVSNDSIGSDLTSDDSFSEFMKSKLKKNRSFAVRDFPLRLPAPMVDELDQLIEGKVSRNQFYKALTEYALKNKDLFI